jgi:hypothetical protein
MTASATEQVIADRFARETAEHQMTVLRDDGLYRHLRFRGDRIFYWFDLITVPGTLIFQGDGQSFVFSRTEDMFEFFRGPVGRINPQYWAEKLTSIRDGRAGVKVYSEDLFRQQVIESFVESAQCGGVPRGTGRALRERVLDDEGGYLGFEAEARRLLNEFEHDGFQFSDTWEWDVREHDWWFLWACHAIVWGIACHDAGTVVPTVVPESVEATSPPKAGRRVETVTTTGAVL